MEDNKNLICICIGTILPPPLLIITTTITPHYHHQNSSLPPLLLFITTITNHYHNHYSSLPPPVPPLPPSLPPPSYNINSYFFTTLSSSSRFDVISCSSSLLICRKAYIFSITFQKADDL
jgi:hypothetical protein